MKRVNLYLISAALLTGFLTSCNDMENFDNNHYELFPIPEKSISVSNVLKQNPGYGGGNEMTKEEAGIYSVKQID